MSRKPGKALAKSLHTVTVLVRLARYLEPTHGTPEAALNEALHILGLFGAADVYDLCDAALVQLVTKRED